MNASPSNRAREVFLQKIESQLKYNEGKFGKMLMEGAERLPDGSVKYLVDVRRLDDFFTALSCGIVFKACGVSLPSHYNIGHSYHSLESQTPEIREMNEHLEQFYSGLPPKLLEFGKVDTQNTRIYTVKIFGAQSFQSSITLVHEFYGTFKVTSMLTNTHISEALTRLLKSSAQTPGE
jgi:hypothetical protein